MKKSNLRSAFLQNSTFSYQGGYCEFSAPSNQGDLRLFFNTITTRSNDINETYDNVFTYFLENAASGPSFEFHYPLKDQQEALAFADVLKLKAREAHRFVKQIKQCDYIEDAHLGFIRQIQINQGRLIQEHILVDPASLAVLFVEDWVQIDNVKVKDGFVAWNAVTEDQGRWYFSGIYLYNKLSNSEIATKKNMFKETFENMMAFIQGNDLQQSLKKQ